MSGLHPALHKALAQDKLRLRYTHLPIVTVSASYKEDLKSFFDLPSRDDTPDVVFSRAHYSMALAIAATAWKQQLDWQKAWMVDPTNHVTGTDWNSIQLTDAIGKTIARNNFLKFIKDSIDKFGRQKLPILKSITPPLLHLTAGINKPILSLHIATGNILIEHGFKVLQIITDPHVREDYLTHAANPKLYYGVFDEQTKFELLEKASKMGKKVDLDRVIVTGPPIDPRVLAARLNKKPWRTGPIKICLTTGGLGTNSYQIRQITEQLLPELRRSPQRYQLMVYAATHSDLARMIEILADEAKIPITYVKKTTADPKIVWNSRLVLLHHPQIVDANELLLKYAFPWADLFMTKPSGDMAYDAAASGSAILTLREWGEWEHRIREIFEQKGVARKAQTDDIVKQLQLLSSTANTSTSWLEQAQNKAFNLKKSEFLHGCQHIIEAYNSL